MRKPRVYCLACGIYVGKHANLCRACSVLVHHCSDLGYRVREQPVRERFERMRRIRDLAADVVAELKRHGNTWRKGVQ